MIPMETGRCKEDPTQMSSDFFSKIVETGQCLDESKHSIMGMPEFCLGREVKFFVERAQCLIDAASCTAAQNTTIHEMHNNMMGVFSFVVFALETALDFDDYETPMKSRTKIIQARDAIIRQGDTGSTLSYKIELAVNSATTSDDPLQNPFEETTTGEWEHLTVHRYEVVDLTGSMAEQKNFAKGSLRLADFMYVRQRIVYDFVTLVAEVAGFADLFLLGFGFLLGTFYQPYMLEASVLKHMGAVELPQSEKRAEDKKSKPNPFKHAKVPFTMHSKHIVKIFEQLSKYSRLQLNCWICTTTWWVPKLWRSARTNKLVELADQGRERMEKALDIRRIHESQQDLKLFLK